MKVAISADGKGLDATIHPRFGRCPFFLIVETDDMTVDVIENSHADLSTGAGIQAASMLVSSGAAAVITGNCGPKAMQVFAETGVQILLNQEGVIREVVEKFKHGALPSSVQAKVPDRSKTLPPTTPAGMGRGGGRGMGGCGRGQGLGGGRGMGRRCSGTGVAAGAASGQPSGARSEQGERVRLQQQADACKRQLDEIEARIKTLS